MKNIALIWLVLGSQTLFAQQILSRADKMNVLYAYISNPITINAYKIPLKEISLEMKNCKIERIDDSHFNLIPEEANYQGEELKFIHKGKVIGTERYRVKSVPSGTAQFGRIYDKGTMSAGEFKVQTGLACVLLNMDICMKYKISSFRIQILRNGVRIADQKFHDGPYFNNEYKRLTNQVQPGDEVLFSEIKYKDVEIDDNGKGIIRSVANPYIRIKIK